MAVPFTVEVRRRRHVYVGRMHDLAGRTRLDYRRSPRPGLGGEGGRSRIGEQCRGSQERKNDEAKRDADRSDPHAPAA